jgi:SAM-dependent methyltransferase
MPADWSDKSVNRIRACVVAICDSYCELIQPNTRLLEIGCGTWSPLREACNSVGAHWEGIDISREYYGKPTIATRIESVEDLSFPEQYFDLVIANQSLEHWDEFGCRPQLGLWQCFRVCRIGGKILMNVPIHFHGARMFVDGDTDAIRQLFEPFASDIELISWRRNPHPLPAVDLLPGFKHTGSRSSYNLDIRATRKPALPPKPRPYLIRWRPFRELREHSIQFHLWRIKQRLPRLW